MSVLTLQQLIEEHDVRHPIVRIVIGGAILPTWTTLNYEFSMGQVPVASITVPKRTMLPQAVREEASVEIWFGYQVGVAQLMRMVFGGAVVDSVGTNGLEIVIDCVMDGPRKLSYGYNRRINYDFTSVQAEASVIDIMGLAGVVNYYVELDPWIIGTAAPQEIQFSTYGEAINKIAEVDASVWYALPTGMVRVENRPSIPNDTARRTYFTNLLVGTESTPPTAITNTNAKPRILEISSRKYRAEVANFIHVDGAVITTLGPNGEQNSNQIAEEVDGSSGQFPDGSYWIPTPPLFQDFVFSNELIDTNAKAFEVAERYFNLKNRLHQRIPLSIPGEPDVFLGSTVKVVDLQFSGISELYFVEGYRTTISSDSCITELQLTGGPESGTIGFASPFAEFYWKYSVTHEFISSGGGSENWGQLDQGGSDEAAKLCEDLPSETGDEEQGGDQETGEDKRMVFIGLDGTASQDFDGHIVSWVWTYTDAFDIDRTLNGPRQLLIVDPDVMSQVEMTLTVTDDSGRTGDITKSIYTSADYIDFTTQQPGDDGSLDDTPQGGGKTTGPCDGPTDEEAPPEQPGGTADHCAHCHEPGGCNGMGVGYFIAAGDFAMGSKDNRVWNDLTKEDAGATGDFISVASEFLNQTQEQFAIFGTDAGEIVRSTDFCETGEVVFQGDGSIETIVFDTTAMPDRVPTEQQDPGDGGDIPVYNSSNPGTLTIRQAFDQCIAVGFSPASAVIAVSIMKAESGLYSNASNSTGNSPPSTDRGIVQFNSYYHPEVSNDCAYNTACAIREFYRVSSGGSDYSQWTTYYVGAHQAHLSAVQEALGIEGAVDDPSSDLNGTFVRDFKIWAGTNTGKLYVSNDSGFTWSLWRDLTSAFPIYAIINSPRLRSANPDAPSMAVFGGDTASFDTLMLMAATSYGGFDPIYIDGALKTAIQAAGAGNSIRAVTMNMTAMLIGFDGGVEPPVWINSDPIGDPGGWVPAIGISGIDPYNILPGGIITAAPGYDGEFIIA